VKFIFGARSPLMPDGLIIKYVSPASLLHKLQIFNSKREKNYPNKINNTQKTKTSEIEIEF
jgi:hypothetical protein